MDLYDYKTWKDRYFEPESGLAESANSMSIHKLEEVTTSAYYHYRYWQLHPDKGDPMFKIAYRTLSKIFAVRSKDGLV